MVQWAIPTTEYIVPEAGFTKNTKASKKLNPVAISLKRLFNTLIIETYMFFSLHATVLAYKVLLNSRRLRSALVRNAINGDF